jgi:hypothetical protein
MSSKDYVLTNHAKDRMKDRGISEEELEMVLKDAEISHPGPRGDINLIKTISGRKIKVAYIQERKRKKIITVMVIS